MEEKEEQGSGDQAHRVSRDHTQHDGAQHGPGSGVVDRLTSGPGANPSDVAKAGPGGHDDVTADTTSGGAEAGSTADANPDS